MLRFTLLTQLGKMLTNLGNPMFYVFDVDMTVALSNRRISDEMADVFMQAMKGKKFFFCSGAQLPKMKQQLTEEMITEATALFPQMGCEMWMNDEVIYKKPFQWPEGLREDVDAIIANSAYPERNGDHLQERGSMICVSTVGKGSDQEQRDRYTAWENEHQEREAFSKEMNAKYPTLEFLVSGQTSVDVAMKGNNKALVLKELRERFGNEPVMFFGDKIFDGGNDMPLAKVLMEESDANVIQRVTKPEDTMAILKEMVQQESAA